MVPRSKTHPALNVEQAVWILKEGLMDLGSETLTRKELGQKLGYANASGGKAARELSALVQYDFIDRRGKLYTLSAFGRYIQGLEREDSSWQAAMRDALERPPIFQKLLQRAREEGRMPLNLDQVLRDDFGITPSASPKVAKIFKDSALVAGVFELDGTLKTSSARAKVRPMPKRSSETPEGLRSVSDRSSDPPASRPSPKQPSVGEQREWVWNLPLNLGAGELTIRLPEPISELDMPLVKRYVDFYLEIIEQETRKLPKPNRELRSADGDT